MSIFNKDKAIELRILGPQGKPYVELENEFTEPFREEGFSFLVPRLFSAPPETTVLITIGIGVITGVSTHLLASFIDKIFKLKKEKEQNNTSITFNIHIGDKYINLPDTEKELLEELGKFKERESQDNASNN
jgi:hypothetical protein